MTIIYNMDKKQLVNILSKNLNISKIKSKEFVENLIALIKEILNKGDKIKINGFGVFCAKEKKQMKMYNPMKQEYVFVKKKIVPNFKPSKEFYIKLL